MFGSQVKRMAAVNAKHEIIVFRSMRIPALMSRDIFVGFCKSVLDFDSKKIYKSLTFKIEKNIIIC